MTEQELRESLDLAHGEVRQLNDRVMDLSGQVEELRRARTITEQEYAQIQEHERQYREMTEEQNKIALWLRQFRIREIEMGLHNGMTLAQVVTMYLGRGLAAEEREKAGKQ